MIQFLIIAAAVLVGAQTNQLLTAAVSVAFLRRRQKRARRELSADDFAIRTESLGNNSGPCPCPDCVKLRELRVN